MTQMLEHLGRLSASDFAALAMRASVYSKLKWDVMVGSRSERIGQMMLKPGIGLGGMAIRHGIPYRANRLENPAMLTECPVMLAEKLVSGVAIPLALVTAGGMGGVLLLGRREGMPYANEEMGMIESFIPHFVEIMNAEAL
ncbi:hypothetical protein D3P08_19565 [Paenibacillus nanensis]|uniref:GAF domain-containing protein n=2 Tax=Paenibacillus nanensis TaxID=393251 RepID=A0A3A1UPS6_9BACL|nr:hypothetical protein D3P08_19565 [Paenibacillus nanensis]